MGVVQLKKSKRGTGLGKLLRVFGIFIAFVLLFELGWLFITSFPQKTVVAEYGSVTKGCWVDTVTLRNEFPITAPADGFLKVRITTGTMIPNGELIGWISRERREEVPEEVLRLSRKLAGLESETNGLQVELNRLNHEMNYRSSKFKSGSLVKIRQNQQDLSIQAQEKERVIRNIQYNRLQKAKLHVELDDLTGDMVFVPNVNPGIFSAATDGFENELKPARLKELQEDIFRKHYRPDLPGKKVRQGEVIGKVVQPFSEVIAVKVNPAQVGYPRAGDKWEIKSGTEWRKIEIIDIISLSKDKMIVGLLNRNPEIKYTPERRRKLFMVYRRCKGISIPVQAIFKKNRRTMVKLVKGDEYLDKEIRVLETDGNQAIVSGLEFGTAILSR
jgi:hypothetical protein